LAYLVPREMTNAFLFLAIYVVLAYGLWSYASQSLSEARLLYSITRLNSGIDARRKNRKGPTKTELQSKFESVRRNMRALISASTAVFPPISDYSFDKLRQSIDVFFYAAGMVVLSEKPDYYSASEMREAQLEEDAWDAESQAEADAEQAAQTMQDEFVGYVRDFDISELSSFLDYLVNRIFRKGTVHPFWE